MKHKVKEQLRILVLVREGMVPPDSLEGCTEKEYLTWVTEWDVISSLRKIGHDVHVVGLYGDLGVIRTALQDYKPDIVFNLLEEFHGDALYDQHVVSFLELMRQPYTGCNPRGLTLSHDKALCKQILAYHRIPVPAFAVFPMGRKVRRPRRLKFPLLVKSLVEEGSTGISRASVVHDDKKLVERVELVHRHTKTPAIAEEYIEGREIYAGVIGNRRLQMYAPWELIFEKLPEGVPNIATQRVKWNPAHQEKIGVFTCAAELSEEINRRLEHLSKRIYRSLFLSGYARLDFRLTQDGGLYLLEANPNPDIAAEEYFASAAEHSGVNYKALLQKIITLGLSYQGGF